MREQRYLDALGALDPAALSYQDWCAVGMALHQEGFDVSVWEDWSRGDPARYHPGECAKKWAGFGRTASAHITGGTLIHMAAARGWHPPSAAPDRALDWEDEIGGGEDLVVVDHDWLEGRELPPPLGTPVQQLSRYLETLFDSSDLVGYVTGVWEKDGKYLPQKGCWDRTAGELLEELSICDGDIGRVLGDWHQEAGAWIRFNPLDGNGVRNENVTRFDYALVESDEMPLEEQYAVYQALELPIACLVSSGGKSLHAIVRVDAPDYREYQKRVDYLYTVCGKNGLKVDRQNRNPSRLSRMPGVTRNGRPQSLLAVNLGRESWQAWREWIESVNDDLPETESLGDLWDDLPPLAPPLIDGLLRQGHKMLLAGPSKAGKSFALIELAIAIAEGRPWLGRFPCRRGRVLYVNLELDRASCLHRFRDVYAALGWPAGGLGNLDVWNLRGRSVPMDQLAPKLIRRAQRRDYAAIILDPIYKVITGDENSADQMARFCNQFDKVCTGLGAAVIYCHHHSKGAQGGKRSMDRASGSGVFARDPDALVDMIQLPVTEALLAQRQDKAAARLCQQALEAAGRGRLASQDDQESRKAMTELCRTHLTTRDFQALEAAVAAEERRLAACTAWRLEGTLREFAAFPPVNVWFDYPIHRDDPSGALADLNPEEAEPAWKRVFERSGKRKGTPESRKKDRMEALETAYSAFASDGQATVEDLAEYMGVTEKTVRNRVKEHKDFWIDGNVVGLKPGKGK